jgi:hypothetical protein
MDLRLSQAVFFGTRKPKSTVWRYSCWRQWLLEPAREVLDGHDGHAVCLTLPSVDVDAVSLALASVADRQHLGADLGLLAYLELISDGLKREQLAVLLPVRALDLKHFGTNLDRGFFGLPFGLPKVSP